MKHRFTPLLACLVVAASLVAAPARASAATPRGPALRVPLELLVRSLHCPASFPRRGHKPVLLVHGTTVTDEENWGWNYRPQLTKLGFDVCTVLMPNYALGDVQVSSEYVVYAIRRMAEIAGRKVDVIGVSQGSVEPRVANKWWPDIRNLIDDYVSMAGTNHGAYFGNGDCQYSCAPALWQQTARIDAYRAMPRLLEALNAGDETPGAVSYTSIYSQTDPVVQPVAPKPAAALDGASNIAVQDVCPGRFVEHLQSVWDAVYYAIAIDALTHRGPADPARVDRGVCTQTAMPGVDAADAWRREALLYAVIGQRQANYPKVNAEPPLAPWVISGAESGATSWGIVKTKDGEREYMLYRPPHVSGPRPLVVYLHGCSERADSAAVASTYNELAERRGFYVVYPEQPQSANGNMCWNWFLPGDQHRGSGEPALIAAVTQRVMRQVPVDRSRVYVTGISAGGAMSVIMGVTYPDLYAAVGAEAGAQYRGLPCVSVPCVVPADQSARWAYEEMGSRARQIPLFAIVGDIDAVSPAEDTARVVQEFLATDDWADDGSNNGSVSRAPHSSSAGAVPGGDGYGIDRYTNRYGCELVERWLVSGMNHAHSGGSGDENWSDPKGPNAAVASYRFFMAHPMRPGRVLQCS